MVLLGYDSTEAWILYNPNKRIVFISKDVLVDEFKRWNWKASPTNSSNGAIIIYLKDDKKLALEAQSAPKYVKRSSRVTQPYVRLDNYEVVYDAKVNADGELMHFALLVES